MGRDEFPQLFTIERLEREMQRLEEIRRQHRLLALASYAYDLLEARGGQIAVAATMLIAGWFIPSPFLGGANSHGPPLTEVWTEADTADPPAPHYEQPPKVEIHLGTGLLCRTPEARRAPGHISRLPRCDRIVTFSHQKAC